MKKPRETTRESSFDVGRFNVQSLKSLQTKYTRDYLPYFKALSEIYSPGSPRAQTIGETIALITRMRNLLGDAISTGRITPEDSKRLSSLANKIQSRKRFFAREAKKIDALHQSLQEASQATGVSLQELNATRERVRASIQLAQEAAKEPEALEAEEVGLPTRAARRVTSWAGRIAPAVGAVTLGPFYPVVEKLAREGIRERRALGGDEKERAWRFPEEAFARREHLPDLPGFPRRPETRFTVQEQAASLMWFFEEGAYKAKWTKELLAAIKGGDVERGKGLGLGSDLGGPLKILGVTAVTAASAFAVPKVVKLGQTVAEYLNVLKTAKLEREKLQEKFQKEEQLRHFRALQSPDTPPEERDWHRAELLREIKEREQIFRRKSLGPVRSWLMKGVQGVADFLVPPTVSPPTHYFPTSPPAPPAPTIVPPAESTVEKAVSLMKEKPDLMPSFERPLEDLNKAVDNLSNQIKENFAEGPKLPITGNIYDSGDTLIQELASGNLTLGGW